MKRIVVQKNDAGQRLDKFLFKLMPAIPGSLLYKYIRKKRVKLNGKKIEEKYILKLGDILELYINDEFFDDGKNNEYEFKKLTPKLSVVYEDENIILVDKPVGMLVHEDSNESINTLINNIKAYLWRNNEYDPESENSFVPALCNRIDRNTGGIVIAAKNAETLRIINEKIKNREIKKTYLCLVCGHLHKKEDTICNYIVKNESQNRVYVENDASSGGKKAITHYKVLKEGKISSLVEVDLLTGRTHQIRAHMAYIGHPLVGDGKYGTNDWNKQFEMKHQALYSYKLKFEFVDKNTLSYLNDKIFEVKNVPFLNFLK